MLCEMIDDELDGAKEYTCEAVNLKGIDPALASTLYDISTQEVAHINRLHTEIARLNEVKMLQTQFKG